VAVFELNPSLAQDRILRLDRIVPRAHPAGNFNDPANRELERIRRDADRKQEQDGRGDHNA
jgi:hypothetical protein